MMRLNHILLASISLLAVAPAQAQTTPAPSDGAATPQDDIIVTGTREKGRTVAASLTPIDVLGKTELQSSGKQSVRDLLGALVPSISVSNSGSGASYGVKTLSLRGLAGDQVLVLVNGKRRHNTAGLFVNGTTQNGQSPPDLDLIPVSAIDHIEVLRDGASSQYGSDAIAGVINVILKTDTSGTVSFTGGANGDGGGETARVLGDFGFKIGNGGHIHLSADGVLQGRTERGTINSSVFYPLIGGQPDPREATVNRYVNKPGQPQVSGVNLAYDAAIPIGAHVELYSFGTASKRDADAFLTFRNPNSNNDIVQIYPDGYIPHLHIHDTDYQVAGGVRGEGPAQIHFDLGTTYSENKIKYDETTALNASLGPLSPTSFYIGRVRNSEWTTNLDLTRKFDLGLASPLFIAAGGEYRQNTYATDAGEPASYIDGGYRAPVGQPFAGALRVSGSQGVTGFSPENAGAWKRHSWSGYVDIEQTVLRGIEVALAGRHEDYSDFGTTNIGKASIRLEPVRGIALRGTVSSGFRAPTLQQQHYSSSSTILTPVNGVTTLVPVKALPVDSAAAIALGAAPLKPEKSVNYSAGVVLTPFNRFVLTVDAYQIKIDDRILLSGTLQGAAVNAVLAAAGITSSTAGFYFSNAADTRTRGLDVVATYRADLGDWGRGTISLSGNINKTIFTHIDLPPTALANAGLVLIDRVRQGDLTQGSPKNKIIANVFWEKGIASINLRGTRYGATYLTSTIAANDDRLAPKVITDIEVGVKVTRGVKVSAGANNLFDVYPSILKAVNQGTAGFAYYNPFSPYGISGGFYYGKLSLTF